MYHIRLFDENKELLSVPNQAHNSQISKTFNETSEKSFLLPDNAEEKEQLKIGREFEIWKGEEVKAAARISKIDDSSDPIIVTGFGYEIFLKYLESPHRLYIDSDIGSSIYGESTSLHGILEALTYDYKTNIINRNFEAEKVEIETDNDISFVLENSVVLEQESTGGFEDGAEVFLYPEVQKDDEKGRIAFIFTIPESYELHRLRWEQEVAETNNIIYRYRTSEDGASWTAWTDWPTVDYSEETPKREGFHLEHSEGANYIQIQFQLINEDGGTTDEPTTRTEGFDEEENEIVIYGSTPILEAVEVIFRQNPENRKIKPHPEEWPEESPEIFDENFDYQNHLNIAINLCDIEGYEFYADGDYKLHLSEGFGEDRTNEVIFRQSDNMNIDQANVDDREQANYLIVLGNGSGLNQLKTVVKDEESIDEYGLIPDTIEFTGIDDITELEEAGQKVLEKRKNPNEKFRIQGVIEKDFPDFNLGDTVRIVIPKDGINTAGRIIEENRNSKNNGEQIILGINDTIDSITSSMTDEPKIITEKRKPEKPKNFTVQGDINKNVLSWEDTGECRIYHTTDLEARKREIGRARDKFVHENLKPGSVHFYSISNTRNGKESEKTQTLMAIPKAENTSSTLSIAAENTSQRGKAGADYITVPPSSQEKINKAIDSLADGGKVVLLEGEYITNDRIKLKNNITLEGQGNSTIIKTGDDISHIISSYTSPSDPERKNVSVKNMKLINVDYSDPIGIGYSSTFDSRIENVTIEGCALGVSIGNSENIKLIASDLKNNTNGVKIDRCDEVIIANNTIKSNDSNGIIFDILNFDIIIIGNTVAKNYRGMFVENADDDGIQIKNNSFVNNDRQGIYLQFSSIMTIKGNEFIGNGAMEEEEYSHLEIFGEPEPGPLSIKNSVMDNIFRAGDNKPEYAVLLTSGAFDNKIINNDMEDSAELSAIAEDISGNNTIKNNVLNDGSWSDNSA